MLTSLSATNVVFYVIEIFWPAASIGVGFDFFKVEGMTCSVGSALDAMKLDLDLIRKYLSLDSVLNRFESLGLRLSKEDFWTSEASEAKEILAEHSRLKGIIEGFRFLESELVDLQELLEIARSEEGPDAVIAELGELASDLATKIAEKKIECLFSNPEDPCDCFLTIQSGAGGTDSNDWAEMLLNMYTRWAKIYKKFALSLIDKVDGEEAGIKSATLKIQGKNAYGWCKTERGIHRLVRISPFNANAKRHTSFAKVEISPALNEKITIEIDKKDLRIETCKASGAGGQHVNKTDSAVKIIHLPTNTVVRCQNNRSQHRNKAEAMQMLQAKLYELELLKKEKQMSEIRQNRDDIAWGNQIRSYVMHPYQLVKDTRTSHETGNIKAVLEGDIDQFITQSLSHMSQKSFAS